MSIPSEWGRLADAEKTLSQKQLNLLQFHEMEADLGELMSSSSAKTSSLANDLFDQVENRRSSLVDREIAISQEAFEVASAVALLRFQMPILTFEQAAERILELNKRVEVLSKNIPSTHRLQETIERSKAEMEHLHFVFVFPQLDELEGDSFYLNMAHFLSNTANQICETGTFDAFEKLSERQQGEVRKLVGFGVSPEGLAHGIELYHRSLLLQAHVAESYFHGRDSADAQYEQLPEEIRQRVEELEQFGFLRTEALMQSLDERMS